MSFDINIKNMIYIYVSFFFFSFFHSTNLVFFDEHIPAQVVKEIIHARFVARERVVVIETVNLNLPEVQLVADEYAPWIYILRQFFCCFKGNF